MPSRAGIVVTRTRTKSKSQNKTSNNKLKSTQSGGQKRCPTCGKFMGNKKNG